MPVELACQTIIVLWYSAPSGKAAYSVGPAAIVPVLLILPFLNPEEKLRKFFSLFGHCSAAADQLLYEVISYASTLPEKIGSPQSLAGMGSATSSRFSSRDITDYL